MLCTTVVSDVEFGVVFCYRCGIGLRKCSLPISKQSLALDAQYGRGIDVQKVLYSRNFHDHSLSRPQFFL